MRVFFAGASGAIGPPAVRELLERGHEVVAMTSSTAKAPRLADLGAEPVVADALDAGALTRAVRAARPDAVVNMMTRIPPSPARPSSMRATNELRERGVRNLSTPPSPPERGARQRVVLRRLRLRPPRAPPAPRTTPSVASATRASRPSDAIASSESQVRAASDERRIEGVSLRFAPSRAPSRPTRPTMVELVRKRRLPVVGAQGATMPVVELGDAARAVADALERAPAGRIYNVADDEAAGDGRLPDRARARRRRAARAMSRTGSCASPRPTWRPLHRAARALPMSNARITEELGWRPRYPTYREALALLDPALGQPPNRPRSASTLAT